MCGSKTLWMDSSKTLWMNAVFASKTLWMNAVLAKKSNQVKYLDHFKIGPRKGA
jgi:hypothetical protein